MISRSKDSDKKVEPRSFHLFMYYSTIYKGRIEIDIAYDYMVYRYYISGKSLSNTIKYEKQMLNKFLYDKMDRET